MTSPLPDSGNYDDSLHARILILRGEFSGLATEVKRSAESQGERVGRVEREIQVLRESVESVRQRQDATDVRLITLEGRIMGALAVLTGAVGVIELVRQLL